MTVASDDVCLIWDPIKPIRYSSKGDTPETVAQVQARNDDIAENNAERTSYCVQRKRSK